jgi:hypothetical protein
VADCEHVKKLHVLRQFTVADGELTVSLQIRCGVLFARHKAEMETPHRE